MFLQMGGNTQDRLHDILFTEAGQCVHDFLRIANVFALHRVCRAWYRRIASALRRFPWRVVYCADADVDACMWLEKLALARVRVRSIHMVGTHEVPFKNQLLNTGETIRVCF